MFVIKLILGNLIKMLITPKLILWTLKQAAKMTDNKIDDSVIMVVEGSYNNDEELVKKGISGLLASYGAK